MTYYIAERNKDTGKMELCCDEDGSIKQYHNLASAIEIYALSVEFEGTKNVMLLESASIKVEVNVIDRTTNNKSMSV